MFRLIKLPSRKPYICYKHHLHAHTYIFSTQCLRKVSGFQLKPELLIIYTL